MPSLDVFPCSLFSQINRRNILIATLGSSLAGIALGQVSLISTVGGGVAAYNGYNLPDGNLGGANVTGLAVDGKRNVYVAEPTSGQIVELFSAGGSAVVAGVVCQASEINDCFGGDGGPAASALLHPVGIAVDAGGNLYIAGNDRIRKVDAMTGIITTVAGNGTVPFCGDGGPATSACMLPSGVALDRGGDLYIADYFNNRIRRVDAVTGIVTTVAGAGMEGFSGDGGPATSAELWFPTGVTLDANGDLYFADSYNNRIRRVDAVTGIITTVAGNYCVTDAPPTGCYAGDGGPATSASLNDPGGVALDSGGNLYIADGLNDRIRKVEAKTGIITTVAGGGSAILGDGGPATSAELGETGAVALDGNGNIYFFDGIAEVREVSSINPAIGPLNPGSVPPGNPPFILTVSGGNFVFGSTVNWNETPLSTNFVSGTQLSAFVPANLVTNAGTASLTVTNPGGTNSSSVTSNAVLFTIYVPVVPVVTGLTPNAISAGSFEARLDVFGNNFVNSTETLTGNFPGSTIYWNGTALPTVFTDSTHVATSIPANLITNPGAATVTVENPGCCGALSSNAVTVTVVPATFTPVLSGLNPPSAAAGGAPFTLSVLGSGFVLGATITWNGATLATTFISDLQVWASISSNLIANAGTATVAVVNPGGAASSPGAFTISNQNMSGNQNLSFTNALRIPHIADGAGWTTTFAIENLDTTPVNYAFNFWDDNGSQLPIQLLNADGTGAVTSGTLPIGAIRFAQSPGISASLLEGWAEAASSGKIGVLALFKYSAPGVPDSQGSVIGTTSTSTISMPYDNTQGYIMGLALANSNPTQPLTIGLTFVTDYGAQTSGQLTLPAHGHTAFVLANNFPATAGTRGSIQFTAPSPDLTVLGERFTPSLSFTTLGTFQ